MTLTPMIFNLGPTELIIILVIVLLLFGGSRLAGLGKSSGRALKEFKEETKGLRGDADKADTTQPTVVPPSQVTNGPVSNGPIANGPVTNGQVDPNAPVYQQMPPNNLADPSAPEVRKDV
jgi:TatA/E family protein of Tat protein translocase